MSRQLGRLLVHHLAGSDEIRRSAQIRDIGRTTGFELVLKGFILLIHDKSILAPAPSPRSVLLREFKSFWKADRRTRTRSFVVGSLPRCVPTSVISLELLGYEHRSCVRSCPVGLHRVASNPIRSDRNELSRVQSNSIQPTSSIYGRIRSAL